MNTALQLIGDALRKIGAAQSGQALPAHEAEDGLRALNDVLSLWSVDSQLGPVSAVQSFPLTGAASYTVGPGGDFNTVLPSDVNEAYVFTSGMSIPLVRLSPEEMRKAYPYTNGGTPDSFAYEATSPLGRLYLNPVGQSGQSLRIVTNGADALQTAYDVELNLTPARAMLLKYELGMQLAAEYGVALSGEFQAAYTEIKKNIRGRYFKPPYQQSTLGGGRGFNVLVGY